MSLNPLERAEQMVGGRSKLAASIGCHRDTITHWHKKFSGQIPGVWVLKVEAAVKGEIPRWEIRPDLYHKPTTNGENPACPDPSPTSSETSRAE